MARVRLPPLRDRTEDIPDLARSFLLRAHREGLPAKAIDAAALDRLKTYDWPGNVRELENLIRRICALYAEDLITARIVERELQDQATAPTEAGGPVTLAALVERHLAGYFADQPDGVPPVGPVRPGAAGSRTPADPPDPGRHPRQPGARRRNPRPEPQYAAQEDPGPWR